MFVYEALARVLRANGTDVMFGVMGDGNLFMVDSFVRDAGGRFISVAHEGAGVLAAGGYTRVTGGVGVATVTHGPALTNAMSALIELSRSQTPIVLAAGDTPSADIHNLQNIDQRRVADTAEAGFVQVRSLETIAEDVAAAFRQAQLERRPVVLNIPADFQWQEVELEPLAAAPIVRPSTPDDDELDVALGMVASARRPVVLAGRGAVGDEARGALLRLARRLGAPVATTLKGRDLFRGEPEDIGVCGSLSADLTIDIMRSSDCVISFGAALTHWTTADGSLLTGSVVQIDNDPRALNRFQVADAALLGDSAVVADEIARKLDEAEAPRPDAPWAADQIRRSGTPRPDGADTTDGWGIGRALSVLDAEFDEQRTLVLDAGRFFQHAAYVVHARAGGAYLHTLDSGCIGLGMATSLGAAVGDPDHPTLLVSGDGGFMMSGIAEFNTAVRHGVKVIVVILNDSSYGAEHVQFTKRGMDPGLCDFDWPDLADLARSLGGLGFTVRSEEDLRRALRQAEAATKPVLIDVLLDPDQIGSPFYEH